MRVIEIILVVLFLGAVYMAFAGIPGGGPLLVVTATSLANLYGVLSWALFNKIGFRQIAKKESYTDIPSMMWVLSIAGGVAMSIALIGLMFKVMIWPSANTFLAAGILITAIVAVAAFFMTQRENGGRFWQVFVRCVVLFAIALFFWITSTEQLLHWKYPQHPDYVKAMADHLDNPQDSAKAARYEAAKEAMENADD